MFVFDETVILKNWESNKDKLRRWILNVVKNQWKCRFKLLNGEVFIGISTLYENDKIEIYNLDEFNDKGDFIGV